MKLVVGKSLFKLKKIKEAAQEKYGLDKNYTF